MEEIKVEVWISEISKLKIFTDFKLYHKENIFAKGNGCWFILNQDTKRPVSTDTVKEYIPLCNEFALGEHKKFTVTESKEKLNEITYKTNLSDIDFNSHVNNKSYINIAQADSGAMWRVSARMRASSSGAWPSPMWTISTVWHRQWP